MLMYLLTESDMPCYPGFVVESRTDGDLEAHSTRRNVKALVTMERGFQSAFDYSMAQMWVAGRTWLVDTKSLRP